MTTPQYCRIRQHYCTCDPRCESEEYEADIDYVLRVGRLAHYELASMRLQDAIDAGAPISPAMVKACIDPEEVRERAAMIDIEFLHKPACDRCGALCEPSAIDWANRCPECVAFLRGEERGGIGVDPHGPLDGVEP